MKRIAVVTASRADWGIYLPVLSAIRGSHELTLDIVTRMGNEYLESDTPTNSLLDEHYDAVVVLGDTLPMLQAAIRGARHNIPVAHIHGGDKTGSIDDKIRPAISSFADWHFPCLPSHAARLHRMGIPKERIKVVGPLGIYAMKEAQFIPEKQLRAELNLSDKPIIILLQHPVWGEQAEAGEQMEQTLEAVHQLSGENEIVLFYPNSEPGSEEMVSLIESTLYKGIKNLFYLEFISLLKYSSLIVGNSSCGLVEAPYFGVPCVNIGTRQNERIRSKETKTVGYDAEAIRKQIKYELTTGFLGEKCINPYDIHVDGAKIIAETLETYEG